MKSANSFKLLLVMWLLLIIGAGLQLNETRWQSSILSFLPASDSDSKQKHLHNNPVNQQVRLLLQGGDADDYSEFARQLWQADIGVAWLKPTEQAEKVRDLYAKYSGLIVTDTQLSQLANEEYESLINHAWKELSSPAPIVISHLEFDPLLLTESYVKNQVNPFVGYTQYGFEVSQNPPIWLLFGSLEESSFDREAAELLTHHVRKLEHDIQASNPDFEVATSGIAFHTAAAASQAEWEVNLFGGLSLFVITVLIWLVLGRFKPLLATVGVLFLAASSGLAVVIICFADVHLIALVFATTLIGIAVDYAIHGVLAVSYGKDAFKRMIPHLRLGVATTLLAYIALWILPFELLKQVAVFIGSGLIVAYLSVRTGMQNMLGQVQFNPHPYVQKIGFMMTDTWGLLSRRQAAVIIGVMGVGAVIMLPQLHFSDQVVGLTQSPAELMEQEQNVHQWMGATEGIQTLWVVQEDTSTENLLRKQEALRTALATDPAVKYWQMLADSVPSLHRQNLVLDLQDRLWQSPEGQAYLAELGLAAVSQDRERFDLAEVPAWQRDLLLLESAGLWVSFTHIQARKDFEPNAIELAVGMDWYKPIESAEAALGDLRHQLYLWITVALVAAFGILYWKRGGLIAATGVVYLFFIMVAALKLSQLLGYPLNIFHLVAIVLVLSLAIDYLVFFSSPLAAGYVQIAVALSALTSLLAFGMLAFSATPAIASFGHTVLFGILIAALLAPLFSRLRKSCEG